MTTENRPKIRIEWQSADWLVEGLAFSGLLLLFLLPAVYYADLPEVIPQHFDGAGTADGFGPKSVMWWLPGIGLMLYLVLTVLNRMPHIFNYPVKITPENAERQYTLATRLLRALKTVVMILFAYLAWGMISVALNKTTGLHPVLLWGFILGILAALVWYWRSAYQKK